MPLFSTFIAQAVSLHKPNPNVHKNVLWSVGYILNQGNTNHNRISYWMEISLVRRSPRRAQRNSCSKWVLMGFVEYEYRINRFSLRIQTLITILLFIYVFSVSGRNNACPLNSLSREPGRRCHILFIPRLLLFGRRKQPTPQQPPTRHTAIHWIRHERATGPVSVARWHR